jgi:hypothetical protein
MSTEWVITAASERVELRGGKAETTFTVTNPSAVQDRVVFEVVAGDGADASWFQPPPEPQLLVAPNGSATFLVKIEVPATAAGGTYWLQARAYSADTAPEEGSRLSARVAFAVGPPLKPKKPWWPWALAGTLVLVVLVVLGIVIFGGEGDQPPPSAQSPSPSASPVRPLPTPIFSRRNLDVPQTFVVTFSTGAVGGGVGDIWFQAQTATIRSVDPRGGAQIGLLPSGTPASFTACAQATLSATPIPIQSLQQGSVFCVRTAGRQLAVVTVLQPVGPSPGHLFINYDLFAAQ